MSDLGLTDFFLTGLVTYGAPMLGLALLFAGLGLPLPATLFLLATGAFIRQGMMDWTSTLGLGLLGVIVGDSASYVMGRFAGDWAQRRFNRSTAWQLAQDTFARRGGTAIYLTRFLLTPLAIPTNLIAGGSRYAFWRFLGYDVAGEVTWIVLYVGLGYAVGSQWEMISQLVGDFSGLLVGLAALGAGVYLFIRRQRGAVTSAAEPAAGG